MKANFDHTVKNCNLKAEFQTVDEISKLVEALSMYIRIYNDPQMERLLEIAWECLEHRESEIVI